MELGKIGENKEEDVLKKYGRIINEEVIKGKIDPIIGRDEEIRRIIKILCRKTKNNPILIGEPGVGKTAIVEGLAKRIVEHDVPLNLQNKSIFELDLASLVAGAKYRGEFEERFKAVLNKIATSNGQIILFIDEVHNIVGVGNAEGSLDVSNMLKPMLARGELHCIGATTINEFRKYIEKDVALERRFQQILIEPPTVDDTISILRGLKDSYEAHHGVKISDEAIISAATLSNRYISDRFLPDKAIDLIDEACASIRMEIDSMPVELDDIHRKLTQKEIERHALSKETDTVSKNKVVVLSKEIASLKDEESKITTVWNSEKKKLDEIKKLKIDLDVAKTKLSNCYNNADYNEAAKLQYQIIPELEKKISSISEDSNNQLITETVTGEEIAKIVSKWTKIPVSKIMSEDRQKLLNLENILKKSVIGQDNACKLIANAILRQRAGVSSSNRPLGSFMFIGPTGVGKTHLAKSLADALFDSEQQVVRIDMSEYMDKFSVTRLIGSPPGYVGFEEGGQLTEAIRRKPYSIVLFDEIEKAHSDVFNILLQILDDGRLTDGKGKTVDFKNTIIIMTSNLGSELLLKNDENYETKINDLIKSSFKPEFVNRIDEIIIFNSLGYKSQVLIAQKLLNELFGRLRQNGLIISFTADLLNYVVNEGLDLEYGARPLKRFIQRNIEVYLSKKILENEIKVGVNYTLDFKDENFVISYLTKERSRLSD